MRRQVVSTLYNNQSKCTKLSAQTASVRWSMCVSDFLQIYDVAVRTKFMVGMKSFPVSFRRNLRQISFSQHNYSKTIKQYLTL